jgi:hypothetical protein
MWGTADLAAGEQHQRPGAADPTTAKHSDRGMFALGEKRNPGNANSKMVRRRRSVLLLLALTVLSPLALYASHLSAVLSPIRTHHLSCPAFSRANWSRFEAFIGRVSWHCGSYSFCSGSCRGAGLSGRNNESGECFWRFRRWIWNSLGFDGLFSSEMLWQGLGIKADKLNALPLVIFALFFSPSL